MTFRLEIIPGTKDIVLDELKTKFPNAQISQVKGKEILFDYDEIDIDKFRALLTPLLIEIPGSVSRNLYRREWKVASVPAGVNPALACVMCTLAKITPGETVYDPFCGTGTIPLSAAIYYQAGKSLASDKSGSAIDAVQKNLTASRLSKGKLAFFRSNVANVKLNKHSVDKILTNLPFGVRVGSHNDNLRVYRDFANLAKRILKPTGKLVVLTQEKKLIEETFGAAGFELIEKREVKQGGLLPCIYVYKCK